MFYFLVSTQYRESYGSRWKPKGGEDLVVTHTHHLADVTLQDFLAETGDVYTNKFSRSYVTGIYPLTEEEFTREVVTYPLNTDMEMKVIPWKKGEDL